MNGKILFMFPGQGSQRLGMRSCLTEGSYGFFKTADDVLGFNLSGIIDNGPEDILTKTSNAQPALVATEIAYADALVKKGFSPEIVMGHSLGEYSALCFSGVIEYIDTLKLVRKRGEIMEKFSLSAPGKMAAVIGADREKLSDVIINAGSKGIIEITNFNSPQQVVLSGENGSIDEAVKIINEENIGKAVMLNVSGPFHSSLMKPAAEEFKSYLSEIRFNIPKKVFIDNVTGMEESDPEKIREKLFFQLFMPVMWETSVKTAHNSGAGIFIESGPGNILSGLVKRIIRGLDIKQGENILGEK
jgi:[acyl-carrier-protein] S-malonyltransferase